MQIITLYTAKLATEKGFDITTEYNYCPEISNDYIDYDYGLWTRIEREGLKVYNASTQEELKKFIREKRGVHIEIHRNASGYYWSMCRSDGGTDLCWSENSGPNAGGVWDNYEDAFEDALHTQLSYDLPKDKTVIKHWGNYVDFALKRVL